MKKKIKKTVKTALYKKIVSKHSLLMIFTRRVLKVKFTWVVLSSKLAFEAVHSGIE